MVFGIFFFFFFKQKTAYEMLRSLVGSEMCIRDSPPLAVPTPSPVAGPDAATTVQDLTATETANAAARSDDAIVAVAGALAGVLGSVAAIEAVHATVLATVLATVPASVPGPGTPP